MSKILQFLKRKKGIIILLLVIVGSLTAAAFFWETKSTANDYIAVPIERGDIKMTVSATGTVQAITTVQVGSQISGIISLIGADFNSRVKKGEVIAKLDPSTFQSQVDNEQAALQSSEAAVETARKALSEQEAAIESARANSEVTRVQRDDARRVVDRNRELTNVISAREVESAVALADAANARYMQANAQVEQARASAASAKAKLDQSKAQVAQARAMLDQSKINLDRTIITSPIDGVVVSRNVDVGQTVAASLQAPTLFTIANDLTKMQVLASIDEADVGRVKEQQRAAFTVDAYPGDTFIGIISQLRLNPTTTQNVVIYSAVIQVDNPEEKLRPGMTANITIPVEERNGVLKVPNAALRFKPPDRGTGAGDQGSGRDRQGSGQNSQKPRDNSAPQKEAAPSEGAKPQEGAAPSGSSQNGQEGGRNGRGGRRNGDSEKGGENPSSASPDSKPDSKDDKPSEEVRKKSNKQTVWIMSDNGKIEPRRVEVGITDGRVTEVIGGDLNEGDRVVIGLVDTGGSSSRPQNTGSPFNQRPGAGRSGSSSRSGGGGR